MRQRKPNHQTPGGTGGNCAVTQSAPDRGKAAMSEDQRGQKAREQVIVDVLGYIEKRGSFRGFLISHHKNQTLMKAAIEQNLIVWDKIGGRYDLTAVGRERLAEYRHKIATRV